MATAKATAKDVAREYSSEAAWVPTRRAMPPASEAVEVLYADGLVCKATRAGSESGLFLLPDGGYRYVDVIFWRPLE